MIKFTIPQLMLLEAGELNRRGFLKFLGSAVGASSSSPISAQMGLAKKILNLIKKKFTDEQMKETLFYILNGESEETDIPLKLVVKWFYNKTFSGLMSDDDKFLEAVEILNLAKADETFATDESKDLVSAGSKALNDVIKYNGSLSLVKKLLSDPINRTINSSKSIFLENFYGMWWDYFTELEGLSHYNSNLMDFVTSNGFKFSRDLKYNYIDFDKALNFLESSGVASKKQLDLLKNVIDNIKNRDKAKDANHKKEDKQITNWSHTRDREFGYEKRGQFDPTRSRPVSALPFEERLKTRLIINN